MLLQRYEEIRCCTSVTEPLGHIVPVIKADLDLCPSIAQSQVRHENTDLTDIGLKPNINMHYPVRKRLDVALKAQIKEKNVTHFVIRLVLIQVIS